MVLLREADLRPTARLANSPSASPVRIARLRLRPGWIVVFGCAAVLVRAAMHLGLNTDAFWHLAAGNWMLGHHAVLRRDVFSFTVHGRAWVSEEWGFELLLAAMVRDIGPTSYWILSGGVSALALLVSALRARLQGATSLWVALLSIVTSTSLLIGLAPRPQDLSYLFFAAELLTLSLARRGRRRALLALPVLFVLWANVHGSFVAGLLVLGLEAVLAVFKSLPRSSKGRFLSAVPSSRWQIGIERTLARRDALGILGTSIAATLVNPNGAYLLVYATKVTATPGLSTIEEWQSPNFHSLLILCGVGVPILAATVLLATTRARTEFFDVAIWLALAIATLHAVRFAPYLGIAFAGLAARWPVLARDQMRPTLLTWPVAAVLGTAMLLGPHVSAGRPQAGAAPVAAVDWLAGRPGRMFSSYEWNDYLISRSVPVFVDGRTDLYFGTRILSTYEAVSGLDQPPEPTLKRWNIHWVLWPANAPLSNYLSTQPQWRLVRRFAAEDIFERVAPR